MRERKDIVYHIVGREDAIDEKGNQIIQLRNIYYGDNENNLKLDLRKWLIDADGEEIMGKGLSFLTEEGPNTLSEVLIDRGYGNTTTILKTLQQREDFRSSLNIVLGKEDELYDKDTKSEDDTLFYDPKQCELFSSKEV